MMGLNFRIVMRKKRREVEGDQTKDIRKWE